MEEYAQCFQLICIVQLARRGEKPMVMYFPTVTSYGWLAGHDFCAVEVQTLFAVKDAQMSASALQAKCELSLKQLELIVMGTTWHP